MLAVGLLVDLGLGVMVCADLSGGGAVGVVVGLPILRCL